MRRKIVTFTAESVSNTGAGNSSSALSCVKASEGGGVWCQHGSDPGQVEPLSTKDDRTVKHLRGTEGRNKGTARGRNKKRTNTL